MVGTRLSYSVQYSLLPTHVTKDAVFVSFQNYVIVGEEILMSCSTDQSATGILIDPAQTPSRELNIESSVLYFVLVRECCFPLNSEDKF